jgi:hypothetical protein
MLLFTNNLIWIPTEIDTSISEIEEKEKIIEFQLVETDPDLADEQPQEETNLVSDKNTTARDESQDNTGVLPWSEGVYDNKDFQAEGFTEQEKTSPPQEKMKEILKDSDLAGLLKKEDEKSIEEYFEKSDNEKGLTYENLLTSVPDFGGVSFNTYDWDFAPYLLAMKRKISERINPPYAFTHMGIISGENIIRFIVDKNGSMRDLRIIDTEGHESLLKTSQTAIELAEPFMPLPGDFPVEYLEVTAKFAYIIRKN